MALVSELVQEKCVRVCPSLLAGQPEPGGRATRAAPLPLNPTLVALLGLKGTTGFCQRLELLEQLQALR